MKEKVVLFGASGTMGFEAFKELWKRKDKYQISLLLLPSPREKELFKKYEREAGILPIPGRGVVEGNGLKIVWGDATVYTDVEEAVRGGDWVLNAMALISPLADYYPETARRVNIDGVFNIIKAIKAQPGGADRIKYVHTGTVAQTGDRLPPIHVGRVGDPLIPSVFDYYAVTKIIGERAVLESDLRYWVSLRMTFIMPVAYQDYLNLWDPIMFHQPIQTCMENITSRDAGLGLVNCLEIPDESEFWRKVYNMGGGPEMRCSAYDFMKQALKLGGISAPEAVMERNWFALRNFHMQYYEDSHLANRYLGYWRDSIEDWLVVQNKNRPIPIQIVAWLAERLPFFQGIVEKITYRQMKKMALEHKNGTGFWVNKRNDLRVSAFYKDYQTYHEIPKWTGNLSKVLTDGSWIRLDHGYDEGKDQLDLGDLKGAAKFRGGDCISRVWEGDLYKSLVWRCADGHGFTGKPYTILKAGHWCPDCVPPPWDFDQEAKKNPFIAQVWYTNHDRSENHFYPEECLGDIAAADQ